MVVWQYFLLLIFIPGWGAVSGISVASCSSLQNALIQKRRLMRLIGHFFNERERDFATLIEIKLDVAALIFLTVTTREGIAVKAIAFPAFGSICFAMGGG
jgi:hypothetical protein